MLDSSLSVRSGAGDVERVGTDIEKLFAIFS